MFSGADAGGVGRRADAAVLLDNEVKCTCNPPKEAIFMPHPRFSSGEIARRGEELYEHGIRAKVETEENIGKMISIDIETGDYSIDVDPLVAGRRLQAKNPDVAMYGMRIGYDAVYAIGGSLTRTAK